MGLVVDDRLGCIVRIEAWSPAAKSGVGTGWVVLHHEMLGCFFFGGSCNAYICSHVVHACTPLDVLSASC